MAQSFKCNESDCTEKVDYLPDNLIAFKMLTAFTKPKSVKPKIKTVYLTCSKGHTHPYRVQS